MLEGDLGRFYPVKPTSAKTRAGSHQDYPRGCLLLYGSRSKASYFLGARLRYTASTNISVVQKPVSEPYRGSESRVGLEALTCSRLIPLRIETWMRSRMIVT